MQREIPLPALLFTPSLHAIMHIDIIRPFQRHRNIQKDPFHQIRRDGIRRQHRLWWILTPDRSLEAT